MVKRLEYTGTGNTQTLLVNVNDEGKPLDCEEHWREGW